MYQAPELDVETVIVGSAPVPAGTPDQATWPSQEGTVLCADGTQNMNMFSVLPCVCVYVCVLNLTVAPVFALQLRNDRIIRKAFVELC